MKIDALARLERYAKRIAEIAAVLGRYGLADLFGGFKYSWLQDRLKSADGQSLTEGVTQAARVRMALTELGTTFIKLGQMLSTRADLLGPELTGELSQLQSSVPPDPSSVARATIESELGQPVDQLFASFDDTPLAAASVAQVHAARLHTGQSVVVKVRRCGVVDQAATDVEILQALAELLEKNSPALRSYQPLALVRQFRRSLLRELDLTYERQNQEEFARNFATDPTVCIPELYGELCSHQVITMERLDGISGTDIEALKQSGEDLGEFAHRGANMYLEMIFRDGFYHADPHPGNLMLLPGNIVGVIDCGMVGRIDEDLRDEVEALLLGIVENDSELVSEQVLRLGAVPHDCAREKLRTDLQEFMADYTGHPLNDIHVGAALTSLVEIIRSHQIMLPPALAGLLKTLIVLEGTSRRFSPDVSLAGLMQPYCTRLMLRRFSPGRVARRARRTFRGWDRLFNSLPRDITDLLARFRDGSFTVHLDHRHLDPIINRLVLGILTAAIFLGSSELWSRQAAPLFYGVSVFGALGYAVSLFLGWRLLRAIRKSGNIQSKD
ncbi:ABC1 kinase family protein [Prosthecobacter vanneervenii]|uniref:Ubiquinone biosynthesis protein n=1 Tax=Prosthecobacter vanneervenii TaxID=48466 RepID=A0A7W8DJX5_9BACT|nr:AarF/UbiB family protein [Prosthecobacter vanneervenii]MBB5032465.1 ubiquinone biosynthesis protein [Prosthecobacter vanneervenii]